MGCICIHVCREEEKKLKEKGREEWNGGKIGVKFKQAGKRVAKVHI